jgi:type I restriction enzyme S subunit
MASELRRVRIAELLEANDLIINDGYRAKNSELSNEGLPFARAQNINNGFRFEDADCFPEEALHKVGVKISQPGDVVFTSKGTVGRLAFVREDTPPFVYAPQLCFWRSLNREKVDPQWLYYWMHSREFVIQYSGVAGQTDMAEYVSLGDQRRMYITLPSLQEQHNIAHILGTLDNKIELNRRMNETLESIARAIFKSWFVDFDPVHAKADGRQPVGMDEETAALFPDSFEESTEGQIPIGWHCGQLSSAIELIGGGTPKTSVDTFWGGNIPWFSVVDIPRTGDVFVIRTEKTITEEGLNHSSARLLPRGTTIITARGTVGKCALVGVPMAMNQSCYGIRPRGNSGDYYTYFLVRHVVGELQQKTHGSVFETITRETFRSIQILNPPAVLIVAFEKVVSPLLESILCSLRESRALIEIRDTLLPKLISGEIRLKDAEKPVEEHAG